MKIVIKKYNISNKLNKKIVLLSDMHYYSKKDIYKLNKILDNIKKISPNYICITGDVIDNSNVLDMQELINWLKKLSNICKVFIIIGNHEFYYNKKKHIYKLNKNYLKCLNKIDNLYLLDNKNIIIDNINFIGLTLPIEHYNNKENSDEFKKYIEKIKLKKEYYNILLCHSPLNVVNEIDNIHADLVLSGHTHGGMMPRLLRLILKHRGLISPQKEFFPKFVYGLIKKNNKNIIITSGVKILSESHTFNNYLITNIFSSEIVEINL